MTRRTDGSAPAAAPREPVLVTGGTGFLGAALTRRLLADGVRVRVLARSRAKAKPLADLGAQITIGDITDQAAVRAAVDGIPVVYHLAGPLLVPGVPATEYQRTHVLGTKLLLDCCAEVPGLERVVYCSTTGVLGVTGDRPADEEVAFRPTNDYERAKADAEVAVRRRWQDGFPVVIARPGLVYGPGDIHLLPFFQTIQRRFFLPIGRRKAWLHPIYIDDMTEALVRCGQRPAAIGECFHFAGKEPVPIAELASTIARAEGTRLLPGNIPVFAARLVAGLGDRFPAGLRERAPLTRSRLDFLTHSRMYDVSKARWLLDFAAATDLATGITQTVAWYRQHGYLPPQATSRPSTARTAEKATEGTEKKAAEGTEKGVPECEFGITSLSPRRAPRTRAWGDRRRGTAVLGDQVRPARLLAGAAPPAGRNRGLGLHGVTGPH